MKSIHYKKEICFTCITFNTGASAALIVPDSTFFQRCSYHAKSTLDHACAQCLLDFLNTYKYNLCVRSPGHYGLHGPPVNCGYIGGDLGESGEGEIHVEGEI